MKFIWLTAPLFCGLLTAQTAGVLNTHPIRYDSSHGLISWIQPQDRAWTEVIEKAWGFLLDGAPRDQGGRPVYYTYCCIDNAGKPGAWPHNPAMMFGNLAESAARWYAFSGDKRVLDLGRKVLDYQIAHGTVPATAKWGGMPYASSNHGDAQFRGANDKAYDQKNSGRGDGPGFIEPDKGGEIGVSYLLYYKITGDSKYLDAARAIADALVKNRREGNWRESPWPFRVNAETGAIREQYCANIIVLIRLFDGLIANHWGGVENYRKAREAAWKWMMEFPMRDDLWANIFEDVESFPLPTNVNQYSPMETARYLMLHPDRDPQWRAHTEHLIDFVERHFAIDVPKEPGVQWGATAISEQIADMNKMGSHTSRYASILAMLAARTGDRAAKEKAFRSFNWASYMCRENGMVNVGPVDQSIWFTDGYGDYIRHFLTGMGSFPEWAPNNETHLLRSASAVTEITYEPSSVRYRAWPGDLDEVAKLAFRPARVTIDGVDAAGSWKYNPATHVLTLKKALRAKAPVEVLISAAH